MTVSKHGSAQKPCDTVKKKKKRHFLRNYFFKRGTRLGTITSKALVLFFFKINKETGSSEVPCKPNQTLSTSCFFDGPGSAQGTSSGCAKFLKRRSTASPWQSSVPELSGFMPRESVLLPKESCKFVKSGEAWAVCRGRPFSSSPRKLPSTNTLAPGIPNPTEDRE